jgi:maltose alpha-D-glucosyltransferase/alpha-amylase
MNSPDPLWYKDAVIYQLHVKAFCDSNHDGIGDFRGLTSKLDYLKGLGVTALWLLPFYPSPLRDDGYDIADFRAVHPAYGTMADFKRFVREAHRRDLRVITELVINHTSDRHPWFQRARAARPGSRWRNYYVWSDTDRKYAGTRIIFLDTEKSNWSWDPVASAYYWHRFYSHQPDLNFDEPAVFREVVRVMRFWLDCGVDGLRLDAVPYLFEREGTSNENLAETHALLKRLRAEVDRAYPAKMLLAEANQWPEDVLPYFGNGDECHMAFHFPLMPRLYMALAQEDRHPITDILRQTPDLPANAQWAIFLRNHDELTLEMVTDRERDYLWAFYARDPRARLNLGIRRRLAPLVENDRRRIDLLNSLLLSMPGTPVLYYGDEIGMGDNLYLGDRDGVRTPMQWSPDRNAGFSDADPARLYLPPIMDAVYGYQAVNVEAQNKQATSPLNQMRRMLSLRGTGRTWGRGTLTLLYPRNRKILAYLRCHEGEVLLCVANLSRGSQPVELDLTAQKGRVPVELFDRSQFPAIDERPYTLTLPGHAFYWFALVPRAELEDGGAALPADGGQELITLVLRGGWEELRTGRGLADLTREALPRYLPAQRWFGAKDRQIREVRVATGAELPAPAGAAVASSAAEGWRLIVVEADLSDGSNQRYCLPLGLAWGSPTSEPVAALLPQTVAFVRRFRAEGSLYDAGTQEGFVQAVLQAMVRRAEVPTDEGGTLAFLGTSALAQRPPPDPAPVKRVGGEQSNSSALIGSYGIFKLYRRVQAGVHPEAEIMGYLTEKAPAVSVPALLGTVEWRRPGAEPTVLGLIMAFVQNQGDAWTYTCDHLKRSFQDSLTAHPPAAPDGTAVAPKETAQPERSLPENSHHALYLAVVAQLGRRTAELHRAFDRDGETDPAFAPEPITADDLREWGEAIRSQADRAIADLQAWAAAHPSDHADTLGLIGQLAALRPTLDQRLQRVTIDRIAAVKTRYHGDLHLGQVLINQSDVVIIDFEGEPRRPLADRRRKHSALKDVAGIIRSFDYAAASAARTVAELPAAELADFQKFCTDWQGEAVSAFLNRYRETIAGSAVWPRDPAGAADLLDLLILDKAFYEIGYELANRPTWIGLPLKAVVDLLSRSPSPLA